MTSRQLETALHIRAGYNSIRSLAKRAGKDRSTIYYRLERLRAQGLITWQPGLDRTLRLTDQGAALLAEYCLIPGGGVGKVEAL